LASPRPRVLVAVGGPGSCGLVNCPHMPMVMAVARLRTRIASPWQPARSCRPRARIPAQRIEQLQRLWQIAPFVHGLPPAGDHPVLPLLSALQVGAQCAQQPVDVLLGGTYADTGPQS